MIVYPMGYTCNMEQFYDRLHAATLLAEHMMHYAHTPRALLLALPRGGVPIARALSEKLNIPWQIFLVRKLGVPNQPELAFGAMASDGTCFLNEEVIGMCRLTPSQIAEVKEQELKELARRALVYGAPHISSFEQSTFIIVDDGIATGATVYAAIASLKSHHASKIVVAVPIIALSTQEEMILQVDALVSVLAPPHLSSIGQYYRDFEQLSDPDVLRDLASKITQ